MHDECKYVNIPKLFINQEDMDKSKLFIAFLSIIFFFFFFGGHSDLFSIHVLLHNCAKKKMTSGSIGIT